MKKVVIFNYGRLSNENLLKMELKDCDIILCADSGGNYAYDLGIIPHFLIGDFDSIDNKILSYYQKLGVKIIKYPVEKDYTDTELCINKAIELGAEKICLIGGIGGRIDHTLANIHLLNFILEKGVFGYIVTDEFYIYLCKDYISIEGKIGDIISLLPINGDARGLFSDGLKYELNNTDLCFGRALGVSNVMIKERCNIKVSKGRVLVFKKI
ncbi:thiamine pyrophosphokinase [Caloramator fervidus]|uniref:Thiamine diphosphokinase n=1 Tax=Caloramator fervidus TaxID=29344 RepID=A0A1H5TY35_9CLOT|nr:thiamine diphosphokinase [Caloramator fervidus]SEF67679.1 thiamine pyrophosphokinase [Caloramator fervidus]